ncbi:MAG: DUF3224 domain-containing protein [Actinomycetota bacterium]|nr:DUF3224 domain-containing protein [Actinomycetota bacterium]
MATASGSFSVSSWKEDAYDEPESGGKLTRATVELALSGAIDGDAAVEWLMAYRADGTAHFVGLARLRGALDGRTGTFVLENTGEFDGMVARGEWSVVQGSGTGDLQGLSGNGGFEAGQEATYTLDYARA